MNTQLLANEEANKRKGLRNSIIIHLLLLLIAWFYMFPVTEKKEAYPPPVVVDFVFEESSLSKYANEDVGKKRAKTEEVKKVKTTPTEVKVETEVTPPPIPNKPVVDPTPSEPIVSEVLDDESPVEAVEEDIEIDVPEEEIIPEPVEEVVVEEPKKERPKRPKFNTAPPSDGKDSEGTSNPSVLDGDNEGSGKGNTGDGKGDGKGDDGDSGKGDGGAGTGEYDGSGAGVFGRKVIYRNTTAVLKVGFENQMGKIITAKFCVNRAGKITYAEILDDETNAIIPLGKERQVLKGIYGYKVEPDRSAPPEQCGKLTIKLQKIDALH